MAGSNKPAGILAALLCGGCSTLPEVTVKYHPVAWTSVASVTQTVGCNSTKTWLFAQHAPALTTAYVSDLTTTKELALKNLRGRFADTDFKASYTEDGRLKSINFDSTGQGEAIVKSIVNLGASLGAFAKVLDIPAQTIAACDVIEKFGDKKTLTLVYKAMLSRGELGKTIALDPSPESQGLHDLMKADLPGLAVNVGSATAIKGPEYPASNSIPSGDRGDVVVIEVQQTGAMEVEFLAGSGTLGKSRTVVPLSTYRNIAIPMPVLFGKQTFSLTLFDSGSISSIGYAQVSGLASAINALGNIAATDTPAAKAADLKAQADLIAQQQRLVLCQTKPSDCK